VARPQGLATLSAMRANDSLEASFSLQRSWASLFRALLLPRGRRILSGPSLHSCTFVENPCGPSPGASVAYSPQKSRSPLLAPQRISLGRGLLALLSFPVSRAFSPSSLEKGHLHLFLPLSLFIPSRLATRGRGSLRVFRSRRLGVFHHRMPARLTSSVSDASHLLRRSTRHGLFFHLRGSKSFATFPPHPLCTVWPPAYRKLGRTFPTTTS